MTFEHVKNDIENHEWYCQTHGTVTTDQLTVSSRGQLLCEICSLNRICNPNADIDTTVTSKDDPSWNKNDNAEQYIRFKMDLSHREIVGMVNESEHMQRDERAKQAGTPLAMYAYHPSVCVGNKPLTR